jgi:hypothetical protein
VIRVAVTNETGFVVGLDVRVLKSYDIAIVVVGLFVVTDPEIGMAKASRPKRGNLPLILVDLCGYIRHVAISRI